MSTIQELSIDGLDLSGAKALVTGGAGFVGSHLVDSLIEIGCQVRILDNLSTGKADNINSQAEFLLGDVRNPEDVKSAVEGVDFVFHQAAQINPAKAVQDPMFDFEVNAKGTLNLLFAAHKTGVKKFLLASTNLYGDATSPTPKVSESLPILAMSNSLLSPYAASKASAEAYLKVFNDEFNLPTVRLRYTNIYGPRQQYQGGSGVLAIFTERALRNQPLSIFGSGNQSRDFVYVKDVVRANIQAALSNQANGQSFNIGSGKDTTVIELARKIIYLTKSQSLIEYLPTRVADFQEVNVDITKAKDLIRWQPLVSLDVGLTNYIEWLSASCLITEKTTK
ncbi:NAD-dependent epimerase/dehydratase family protein [Anabaena azotica]|uniref:NAD-dependent epimerase/dehydratase family protein n=1 Tax=Anabaena azotica FACHB-119 TaxID=947527 RepID=A0ABR8D6B2_9NOST|nr:NAD-dependent epimerase/dehydratase family protein [Anabaena azotica]MBD2502698.1 NAD-dependent epimerase/dehydratase family protein [Anabaena azotica FACHB-119]